MDMFRIGEFSKMTKTTIKTLRYYDEAQLLQLHRIQSLRQAGLSIEEIRQILKGTDAVPLLEKRREELLSELTETQHQLSRIQFILHGKEEEYFMNYTATLKDLPALGQKMAEKYPDLQCAKPEYCFIVYLDGEYKEKDINVEYCEAVTEMKPDFDDIHFKKMESVPAVTVMHKGPYAGLSQAYAFAFQWIEENGMIVADSPRESYIDGIWNKESEEDWLTELQIPIKKRS
jgi:DNA-binding transcriptional MerR regulator